MTITELVEQSHGTAVTKGWWEPAKSPLEIHMLIVSEVAEAAEAARQSSDASGMFYGGDGKPEGEAVELADAVIRIADYFGWKGWDLDKVLETKMRYNTTRPHRHGGKLY